MAYGSAPRVRGTGNAIWSGLQRPRFSPACAGNGSQALVDPAGGSVQPRVCGERADFQR